MVASKFTLVVPYSETEVILVNTLSGALDVVERQLPEYLALPLCNMDCEETHFLVERGYLLPDRAAEEAVQAQMYAPLRSAERAVQPVHAMFILSFGCNLRCCYCWQQHRVEGTTFPTMTTAQVDDALQALQELQKLLPEQSSAPPMVQLFGGEPLLRGNYDLVAYILSRCEALGFPVSITTNGYELPYFHPLLKKYPVQELQVTVDGDAQTHNARRVGSDWNRLLDSVDDLLMNTDILVKLRVNLDETVLAHLSPLADEIIDRLWYGTKRFFCYIAPLRDSCMEKTEVISARADLLARFLQASRRMKKLRCFYLAGWDGFRPYYALLRQNRMPLPSSGICEVNRGQFVFDPDGTIHLCSEETHGQWDCVGQYSPSFSLDEARFFSIYNRMPIDTPKCRDCALLPVCGGSCNLLSEYPAYQEAFCQTTRRVFDLAIQSYVLEDSEEAVL